MTTSDKVKATTGTNGSFIGLEVRNTTTGTAATSALKLWSDETDALTLSATSTSHSTYAGASVMDANTAAGLSIYASHASGNLRLYSRNTLRLTFGAATAVFNAVAVSGISTLAGTGAVSGFTTVSVTGTVTATVTADTSGLLAAAASGGDIVRFMPRAAGSGANLDVKNSAQNDYEPLNIRAETVTLSYRSGANAVTAGLTLNTSGNTILAGSLATAAPTTGTSGAWKLGIRVAATVALDTTQYIELDVGGTLYKLGIVS